MSLRSLVVDEERIRPVVTFVVWVQFFKISSVL